MHDVWTVDDSGFRTQDSGFWFRFWLACILAHRHRCKHKHRNTGTDTGANTNTGDIMVCVFVCGLKHTSTNGGSRRQTWRKPKKVCYKLGSPFAYDWNSYFYRSLRFVFFWYLLSRFLLFFDYNFAGNLISGFNSAKETSKDIHFNWHQMFSRRA